MSLAQVILKLKMEDWVDFRQLWHPALLSVNFSSQNYMSFFKSLCLNECVYIHAVILEEEF